MTPTTQNIAELLKRALCDAFSVDQVAGDEWIISSPFLYRDGDSFALYLRRSPHGWLLTDDGSAAGHLFFDEYEFNETRLRHVSSIAEANGFRVTPGQALERRLDRDPDGFDVADLLLAMAQVGVLPHIKPEQSDRGFRVTVRSKVLDLLSPEQPREPQWAPAGRERWPSDIRLETEQGPVVAFFVGNTTRAGWVASTISEYREWGLRERPVVGFRPGLQGFSIMRLQDVARDDQAVVPVQTELAETGFVGIQRVLAERGVRMAAA